MAHNLVRWVASIGLCITGGVVARTVRRRFFTLPGRLTRSARRRHLHLPRSWPWSEQWSQALTRLRSVRLAT